MTSVLVTGGAGYIGSHTVRVLRERGYATTVLDNLSTGHRRAVPSDVPFYQGDIADEELLARIVQEQKVDAVIHFAARSLVPESVAKPDLYFQENTSKTIRMMSVLLAQGVQTIVFSSTAAVYGIPEELPVPESAPKQPISPYGLSKWMIEQAFAWMEQAYGLRWVALRYFNACGAALDGTIGEDHRPETHLIPIIMQAALGQREFVPVTGVDYPTPDGTCIRDYVHVLDLADAHVLALEALFDGLKSRAFNVGSGQGYSVRDILDKVRTVTEREIRSEDSPRRLGDPALLVAQADEIHRELGWTPRYTDLDTVIRTAWHWHVSHPNGYEDI